MKTEVIFFNIGPWSTKILKISHETYYNSQKKSAAPLVRTFVAELLLLWRVVLNTSAVGKRKAFFLF
jgi:hypothetical protein